MNIYQSTYFLSDLIRKYLNNSGENIHRIFSLKNPHSTFVLTKTLISSVITQEFNLKQSKVGQDNRTVKHSGKRKAKKQQSLQPTKQRLSNGWS